MAAEVTAPSSSAEHSAGKELNDNFGEQLVNALKPRDYIITVSFVTASELYGDDLESLKASIAEHLTKHLQSPVREVNLSVNILANNTMASPAENDSPTSISDDADPPAEQVAQDESTTGEDVAKASKKVPRPPNAFIIYRKEWHPTIVAANPGLHNNDISVIIGKKWKNEDEEVREKYQRKALKAKHEHMMANPGYQYQPRKPSEKKKRNTKGKLAKIAAKSAKARASASMQDTASDVEDSDNLPPPTPVAPLLTFNEDKTMMSFVPGAGPWEQLAAELTEFNNSKWTAAQQAAFALGPIMPPIHSTTKANRIPQAGAHSYNTASNINMASNVNTASVNGFPSSTSTSNFGSLNTGIFQQSAEDFFDPHSERDSSFELGDLDDYIVDERQDGCVVTGEVFRQFELNEEFQDGLNDFFDFQRFE